MQFVFITYWLFNVMVVVDRKWTICLTRLLTLVVRTMWWNRVG